jgi:riboflavin kinase/FMN adenylyltransferase
VVVPALGNGVPVSSSLIRDALRAGRIAEANHMLGHRWFVIGTVTHGDKRGRTLGFPTANILLPAETPLAHGIYAVRVVAGDAVYDGVASYGRRPTFDDGAAKLEVFLFDFDGDLYGQDLAAEFADFIRPELKFDDVAALVARMADDCTAARSGLAAPVEAGVRDLFR